MNAVQPAPTARKAADSPPGQFLTFSLGEETYATDIHRVREIIQYGPMTTVPMMPKCVRGVINLRGSVVPVTDLQVQFDRSPAEIGKKSCIVIFDRPRAEGSSEVGVLVDAVNEVVELDPSTIEPPPALGGTDAREIICGMGKVDGRFLIIIDPSRVLEPGDGTPGSQMPDPARNG